MIVGLTGGIGSGKSTVAKFFKKLKVSVYDSDLEAKVLMVESQEVREQIMELFGKEAYKGKRLNKIFISEIVFKDEGKLKQLNQIVHPAVRSHFREWVAQQNSPYVIQETALIFENGMQDEYDAIILVKAPEHIRIQRVMERDGVSESQVKARIKNQLPDKDKEHLADFGIENISFEKTRETVNRIHQQLLDKTLS